MFGEAARMFSEAAKCALPKHHYSNDCDQMLRLCNQGAPICESSSSHVHPFAHGSDT